MNPTPKPELAFHAMIKNTHIQSRSKFYVGTFFC